MDKEVESVENSLFNTVSRHAEIVIDKTLIKQFSRRIFGRMKVWLSDDCNKNNAFITTLYGGNQSGKD